MRSRKYAAGRLLFAEIAFHITMLISMRWCNASMVLLMVGSLLQTPRELQLQGIPRRPVMNPLRLDNTPGQDGFPLLQRCHPAVFPQFFVFYSPFPSHKNLSSKHPSRSYSLSAFNSSIYAVLGFLSRLDTSLICRSVNLSRRISIPVQSSSIVISPGRVRKREYRTGRQRLLELLGLLGILQGQGVQVLRASDLELDQRALLVLLDPGGYRGSLDRTFSGIELFSIRLQNVQEASFRRQISMNCGAELLVNWT